MPTVVKTFAFASDAEGLADAGVSAVAFAFLGTDGNPSGCVRFTQATKAVTQSERALRATTGETWETWGVPAGSVVTQVQITAWSEKLATNTKLSAHSISARIVGSGGASVHSAGDLLVVVALGTTVDATWQAGAAGAARAVDSGAQASTTDVRLELDYSVTTSGGGGSAAVDQRFDQIQLTITYSTAPVLLGGTATGGADASAAIQVERDLGGTATGGADASADLTIDSTVLLGGTATGGADASVSLVVERDLGGTATGIAAASADLRVERDLGGVAAGGADASVSLVVERDLGGTATGSGDATADLSVGSTAPVLLGGTATGGADASAALTVERDLGGSAGGGGDAAAALEVTVGLGGAATGGADATAAVTVTRYLSGTATGRTDASATIGESAAPAPAVTERGRTVTVRFVIL